MLVLNSITLFYHNLSCPSDKPTGVIENWTKDVLQGVTKPTTANARITSSATLVTKAKHDQKKSATSKAPLNHKKAAKAPTKLFTTASDEDFPDIRIAESDVLTPPASVSPGSYRLPSTLTMSQAWNRCC